MLDVLAIFGLWPSQILAKFRRSRANVSTLQKRGGSQQVGLRE
jgi:hypothetical protein